MLNLTNEELATIRIAILGKIDDICVYVRECKQHNNESGERFWQESYDKHTNLLNKLYDYSLLNK